MTQPTTKPLHQTLRDYLLAGYPAIFIPTTEENRLEGELFELSRSVQAVLVTWDCYSGFQINRGGVPPTGRNQELPAVITDKKTYKNPRLALDAALNVELWKSFAPAGKDVRGQLHPPRLILHFRDMDDFTADPEIRRILRTACEENRVNNSDGDFRPILISSPMRQITEKLRSHLTVVEFSLPDEEFILREIDDMAAHAEAANGQPMTPPTPELRESIAACLRGLTSTEVSNCLARCLAVHGGFVTEMLGSIKTEKASIVKRGEVLTYIPEETSASREDIAAFDRLFEWLDRRRLAYSKPAQALHLDYPKGVVLLGVPGSGKSCTARAVAKHMGVAGFVLDMGAVFGSKVGESEQRMRDALKQVEAQEGCVLLVDEADKAIGNAHESSGDSGVTRRVFGHFLTWLAEKKDRTFVIMTLNRAHGMPPELLRAGRFDAVFYADLPTDLERRQILQIHLRLRHVDVDKLGYTEDDWAMLQSKSKGFVGAELEEAVREARYLSFQRRQSGDPTVDELVEALTGLLPMSERDPEGIKQIREYCKNRAIPVSSAMEYNASTSASGKPQRAARRVQAGAAQDVNN